MATKCPDGSTWILVTCGEPTKPPHDDEVNPGTCSRKKGFCIAPGQALPDWACFQHGGKYNLVKIPLSFTDCAEAANYFSQEGAEDRYAGQTEPGLYYSSPETRSAKNSQGGWTYRTTIRWAVDAATTTVTLPDVSWPNMTDAEQAAVQNMTDALRAHEEGHIDVAGSYVDELNGSDGKGEVVSASGTTKAEAREALLQALAAREKAVKEALDSLGAEYDAITKHGLKQSAVGGENVILVCPQ